MHPGDGLSEDSTNVAPRGRSDIFFGQIRGDLHSGEGLAGGKFPDQAAGATSRKDLFACEPPVPSSHCLAGREVLSVLPVGKGYWLLVILSVRAGQLGPPPNPYELIFLEAVFKLRRLCRLEVACNSFRGLRVVRPLRIHVTPYRMEEHLPEFGKG